MPPPPPPDTPHPVIPARPDTHRHEGEHSEVNGAVAKTTIRQTLRNDGSWVAEGQYLLPAAAGGERHRLRPERQATSA